MNHSQPLTQEQSSPDASPDASSSQIRCLWKSSSDIPFQSYEDIYNQYCILQLDHPVSNNTKKHQRQYGRHRHRRLSRFRYIANALLVVQEFILTCYFLAWYRIITTTTTTTTTPITTNILQQSQLQQVYIDTSMICMYAALLLAVIINARAVAIMEQTPTLTTIISNNNYNNNNGHPTSSRFYYYYYKVMYRILDATILAGGLRYIAILLRNLTASYSTDTVERLSLWAMILHVLFCDYNYANGSITTTLASSSDNINRLHRQHHRRRRRRRYHHHHHHHTNSQPEQPPLSDQYISKNDHYNPLLYTNITSTFRGGTISLNAAFFATIVLVSRFNSTNTTTIAATNNTNTTTTTTTTFLYISLAVILFAFYPVTRHTISIIYPSYESVYHWCITTAVLISTQCLLLVLDERQEATSINNDDDDDDDTSILSSLSYSMMFWIIILSLGIWIPLWKHHLAQYKVILRGPWDIPTRNVMKLDYIHEKYVTG